MPKTRKGVLLEFVDRGFSEDFDLFGLVLAELSEFEELFISVLFEFSLIELGALVALREISGCDFGAFWVVADEFSLAEIFALSDFPADGVASWLEIFELELSLLF